MDAKLLDISIIEGPSQWGPFRGRTIVHAESESATSLTILLTGSRKYPSRSTLILILPNSIENCDHASLKIAGTSAAATSDDNCINEFTVIGQWFEIAAGCHPAHNNRL